MSKPKDEWEKPQKWSVKRREAIKRNPIYSQEWKAAFQSYLQSLPQDLQNSPHDELLHNFIESSQSEKLNALAPPSPAENLCRRWGLAFALPPNDAIWGISREKAPALFADYGMAVKIIHYEQSFFLPPFDHFPAQPWIEIKDRHAYVRERRYLYLEIDLSHHKNQIEAEINRLLKMYQDLIGKEPKRGKSSDDYLQTPNGPIEIFDIWDMKEKGKSAWQIAKELYPDITSKYSQSSEIDEDIEGGIDGRKNKYTPEAKKARNCWRNVERAIKKAQEEIDSINPTE